MNEDKKLIIKNSYNVAVFSLNTRKELVIRGLNTLTETRDADYYFFKGEGQRIKGEFRQSTPYYNKALQLVPEYKDALFYSAGIAYDDLGLGQDAVEAFKQAIRIDPDYIDSHLGLGFAFLLNGDKSRALEEYKILKELDINIAIELSAMIYEQ